VVRALAPWGADGAATVASPGWKRLAIPAGDRAALESLLQAG
jgi:hypothetical protein